MTTRSTTIRIDPLRDCPLLGPARIAAARTVPEPAAFVIRALDLHRRAGLPPGLPEPVGAEWINRGTGQRLRPTTIAMLLRTLEQRRVLNPSAILLHEQAGLRLAYASPEDRHRFARAWTALLAT